MSSDRVTWKTCPSCGRLAAVGWSNETPVEFDCPAGCRISAAQLRAFADRRRSAMKWQTEP